MSAAGCIGTVECHDRILLPSVGIVNDAGGSSELPLGDYRVKVTRVWRDYETGLRAQGVLLDPADIQTARKAGTTGFSPEHYRERYGASSDVYRTAVAAAAGFSPERVFFAVADFTAGP